MNHHETIAGLIRYFRKQRKLSQLELAKLAGVGKTLVFDIEKGKESVQLNSLLRVMEALDIKLKFAVPFSETKE